MSDWREVRDPHARAGMPFHNGRHRTTDCWWRCRMFVFEYQWREQDGEPHREFGDVWWIRQLDTIAHSIDSVHRSTPEREAMWLDLFLHP